MAMRLHELTIHEAHRRLLQGEISSVELTQSLLDRILAVDNEVRAYLCLMPEIALEEAQQADAAIAAARREGRLDELHALTGIPLAIKDVICVQGVPATCGSRILEEFIPPFEATVIEKLRAARAVILGKTNTDEFAMGSSTENSAYFTTRNPWDLTRVPGGSSGGSAAAVAADECLGALGSDTGGSVRQPASLCGVVGLKPTYGRVSRYGLVAFASSLDQIGALAKDVTDAALLLRAIAGHDRRDSTSVNVPLPDYAAALDGDVRGLRVGVPREYFIEGMQPAVEQAVRAAVGQLADLGAEVIEVSLPHTEYALPVYYLIAPAEASANLARYDGVRYGYRVADAVDLDDAIRRTRQLGFGAEVKRRIMLGTYALSAGYYDAYYLRAQQVRTLIKRDFDAAFERVDVIACPTAPTTAFRIGEKVDDPLQMYLCDVFTLSMNLAGICGLSLPCGFDEVGLPIGLQIMGPAFGEEVVLRTAYAYEQATEWHKRRPSLMKRLEENVWEWLEYAEADRQAAGHLLESGDYRACALHCQQAVEKLLKAVIVAETQKRPPYLHSLRLLLEQIRQIEIPEDVARKMVRIEPHYVGSRYPGVVDLAFYSRQNAEELFAETMEVYQWFLTYLEEMSKSENS